MKTWSDGPKRRLTNGWMTTCPPGWDCFILVRQEIKWSGCYDSRNTGTTEVDMTSIIKNKDTNNNSATVE